MAILVAGVVLTVLFSTGIHRFGSAKAQDSKESKINVDITIKNDNPALDVIVKTEKGVRLEKAAPINPSTHQVVYLRSWSLILLDNKLQGLSDTNGIRSMRVVIEQKGRKRVEMNLDKTSIAEYVMFHSMEADKSSSRISIKIPPLHPPKAKKIEGEKAVGERELNRKNHIVYVSMMRQQADAMGTGTGSGTVTVTITTTTNTTITSTVPIEVIDYTPCP